MDDERDIKSDVIVTLAAAYRAKWKKASIPEALTYAENLLLAYDRSKICPRCGAPTDDRLDDLALAGTIWANSAKDE